CAYKPRRLPPSLDGDLTLSLRRSSSGIAGLGSLLRLAQCNAKPLSEDRLFAQVVVSAWNVYDFERTTCDRTPPEHGLLVHAVRLHEGTEQNYSSRVRLGNVFQQYVNVQLLEREIAQGVWQ